MSQSQATLGSPHPPQAELMPLPVTQPRWWTFAAWLAVWSMIAILFYRDHPHNFINWYTTIVWTMPLGIAFLGIYGATVSRPIIKAQTDDTEIQGKIDDPIVVLVTTRGDAKVIGALSRVIRSLIHFHTHFNNATLRIVTDEGCEAYDRIVALAAEVGAEVAVVPAGYTTAKGTRFKARAQQWALEQQVAEFGAEADLDRIPADHWTYHLDDDTSTCVRTVRTLATFILKNRGMGRGVKHLAQGILAYKLQNSTSRWMWRADAIRTSDDLLRFPATTGKGTPRAGLHGENLLMRTRVEAETGWDHGPNELVEDSHTALLVAEKHPGKSAWLPMRCYGAPPINSAEFVRQRRRWAEGMMALALDGSLPLRERLLILHNMIIWATGLFQPVLVVALISALVGDFNVAPVAWWLAPLWIISVSYTYWAYWEGLRANAHASGQKTPALRDKVLLLPGIVWFSVLEGLGGTLGVLRHFSGREKTFDGIAKPA